MARRDTLAIEDLCFSEGRTVLCYVPEPLSLNVVLAARLPHCPLVAPAHELSSSARDAAAIVGRWPARSSGTYL